MISTRQETPIIHSVDLHYTRVASPRTVGASGRPTLRKGLY